MDYFLKKMQNIQKKCTYAKGYWILDIRTTLHYTHSVLYEPATTDQKVK